MKFTEKGKLTKSGWLSIVAFLLVAVIALSVALGLVVKSNKAAEKVGSAGGSMVVTEGAEGNGVQLTSAQIPVEEFADYGIMPIAESAWTVTATASSEGLALPEDQQKFKWSMAWASANSADVSTYVTMSESGGKTATFSCLEAFSTQITVTCAWLYDETSEATLTLDYAKRLMKVGVVRGTNRTYISPSELASEGLTLNLDNVTGIGTLNWGEEFTIGAGTDISCYEGSVGTVENKVTGATASLKNSSALIEAAEPYVALPDSDTGCNSDVTSGGGFYAYSVHQYRLLVGILGGRWTYMNIIGKSETDASGADLTKVTGLLNALSSTSDAVTLTLTVNMKYGDPVVIPIKLNFTVTALAKPTIGFNESSHVF